MIDLIGDGLTELKIRTLRQVKSVMRLNEGEPRSKLAYALSEIIKEGMDGIDKLGIKDPRAKETLNELEDIFVRITRGQAVPELDNLPELDEKSAKIREMILDLKSDIDTAYIRLSDMARLTGNDDLFMRE